VQIQNGHRGPSDTQAMANAIGGPYWFWGAVCAAFSAAVLLAGLWMYIRPERRTRRATLAPVIAP
jgi:bacteriorhodopsin